VKINILTLFPEFFQGFVSTGIINKARKNGIVEFEFVNIRDFSDNEYGSVDDYPYGGGSGMVMRVDIVHKALESLKEKGSVILLSPDGKVFNEDIAYELSKNETLSFICGRYKGVDARIENFTDMSISIGDYILSGGEIPAMVVIDAVVRLISGVLGNEDSAKTDSFVQGFLEPPIYTRPREYLGFKVPDILLSGNHKEIDLWRKKEAIRKTYLRRKDLFDKIKMSEDEIKLFNEIRKELEDEGNSLN